MLATIAGASFTYVNLSKNLVLDVDGSVSHINVLGRTVDDVLENQNISLDASDHVYPAAGDVVLNGSTVTVRTAKKIELEIDGKREVLDSNAATVGDILDELGSRAAGATVSASRGDFVGRQIVRISTLKKVTVHIDGQSIDSVTAYPTVRDVLFDMGVVLEEGDTVKPKLDEYLTDGDEVTVHRAGSASDTVTEALPFEVVERKDPNLMKGEKVVLQKGRVGKAVTTYDVTTLNGEEADRVVIAQTVLVEPQDEIIGIGTLAVADPSTTVLSASEAKAVAKSMVAQRGWDESEFVCLDKLWMKESRWNVRADNPSSSAYGIPQALPGSKMATAGADWRTNARTQIKWGLGYIEGRYGKPCSAWAHSQAKNWY